MPIKRPEITFICHYEQLNKKSYEKLSKILPLNDRIHKQSHSNYNKLVETSLLSAKLQHPNSSCVFLTNESTPVEADPKIDVVRYSNSKPFTVYQRLEAQIHFLENNTDSNHYLFIDWDILVQKPVNNAFNRRFDIGFTFNFDPVMPINGGVIFVHAQGKEKALIFLKNVKKNLG